MDEIIIEEVTVLVIGDVDCDHGEPIREPGDGVAIGEPLAEDLLDLHQVREVHLGVVWIDNVVEQAMQTVVVIDAEVGEWRLTLRAVGFIEQADNALHVLFNNSAALCGERVNALQLAEVRIPHEEVGRGSCSSELLAHIANQFIHLRQERFAVVRRSVGRTAVRSAVEHNLIQTECEAVWHLDAQTMGIMEVDAAVPNQADCLVSKFLAVPLVGVVP